jgi:hypothetical protein
MTGIVTAAVQIHQFWSGTSENFWHMIFDAQSIHTLQSASDVASMFKIPTSYPKIYWHVENCSYITYFSISFHLIHLQSLLQRWPWFKNLTTFYWKSYQSNNWQSQQRLSKFILRFVGDVTPRSSVPMYWCFRWNHYLNIWHRWDFTLKMDAMRYTKTVVPTKLHGITFQEVKMFLFTAVITSGLTNIKET